MKKNSKTIHYSTIPIACCIGTIFVFVFLLIFGVFKIDNVALILLIPVFILFSLIFKGFFRLLFSFLLGVSLGGIRGQVYYLGISSASLPQKQEVTVEAKVDSDPTIKNGTLRFESSNLKLNNTTINCATYFSLVPSDINISKSDLVLIKGKNSGAFGKYCAFFNKPEVLIISKPDPPDLFIEFRDWFSMRLIEIIDGKDSGVSEMSALGLGYLTGQKRYISEDFNESLRRAGLSHRPRRRGAQEPHCPERNGDGCKHSLRWRQRPPGKWNRGELRLDGRRNKLAYRRQGREPLHQRRHGC